MNASAIHFAFQASQRVLGLNLRDIEEDEARQTVGEAGNCINWLLGHILTSRMRLGVLLGFQLPLTEEEAAPYRQGIEPLAPGRPAMKLARMKDRVETSGEEMLKCIAGLTDAQLEAPIEPHYFPFPVENPTLAKMLSLILFHEAYHVGQIGYARRVLGKPSGLGA